MNAMTRALKTSGLQLPTQNERIWRTIKDHPGLTAVALAPKVGIKVVNVSSLCGAMVKRGMLEVRKEPLRVRSGLGFHMRNVLVYRVHPRMESYELLPLPLPQDKKAKVANVTPTHTAKQVTNVTAERPAPDVDHLTLGQARELYKVLHQLFGGGA